jgi:hypothetical protein
MKNTNLKNWMSFMLAVLKVFMSSANTVKNEGEEQSPRRTQNAQVAP